jgi:transglutaminase-like putative cysteine protease
MKWDITHRTHYQYAAPVCGSLNEVRLEPVSGEEQTLEFFELKTSPVARIGHYHDFYSNDVHHFEIAGPHHELTIESHSIVTTHGLPGLPLNARPASRSQLKDVMNIGRCYDFMQATKFVDTDPETWRLALDIIQDEDDIWQCALRLMAFIREHLTYQSNSTSVHTHMREVLAARRGVCQDFAHVMLGLCRTLKIPALYVSGYLATEIASATHAWVEIYVPGHRWQGLDPTNNCPTNETYVKLAVGRDYADVAPVRGTYKGTPDHTLTVDVKIQKMESEQPLTPP